MRFLVASASSSLLLLASPAAPVVAQELPQTLPPLVVSATRVASALEEVGSSVTVITGEAIERRQERTLPDALRDVPGLNVVQTGGPGGQTSLFMRGTNANHTKVLIDGMPINDPSAPNGAFDFGPFLLGDIERIEVLRGPQSGIWGADALGGVVSITTRRGDGPPTFRGSAEGGSFDTFNQFGSFSGGTDRYDYAVNVGHLHSGDTPVTPERLLPPGRARIGDDHENTTFSTKLGVKPTATSGLGLSARYSDARLRFTGDDFSVFPTVPAAAQSRAEVRQFVTRGEGRWSLFDGRFEQVLGIGYTDDRSRNQAPAAAPGFVRGDRIRADWLGTVRADAANTFLVGLEHEREELRDSPISADNTNNAGFVEWQTGFFDRLFASATVRVDDNGRFGTIATWRLAPSFLVREAGTRFKGSVGTGFKAPSLNQLFVDLPAFRFFANPNLRPEESLGWDLGFEQAAWEKRLSFGATWFHNDIDNLITPNATFTSLENRPKADTYGVESFAAAKPWDGLALRADYTYTLARDADSGGELLRRPKHKASLNAAWQATSALELDATVLHVGTRIDGNRDFSVLRMKANGYTVMNLAGSYALTERLAAFARIDNLFDRRYEEPSGSERPGLGVFVGLRVRLDAKAFDG